MIVYEIVAILSSILSAMMLGAFCVVALNLKEARAQMLVDRVFMDKKVKDFDEITRKASEANVSQANKIVELENTVLAFDERLAMLSGNATLKGAGNTWQTTNPKKHATHL